MNQPIFIAGIDNEPNSEILEFGVSHTQAAFMLIGFVTSDPMLNQTRVSHIGWQCRGRFAAFRYGCEAVDEARVETFLPEGPSLDDREPANLSPSQSEVVAMPAETLVPWGLLGLQGLLFQVMVFSFGLRIGQGRKFAATVRGLVLAVLFLTMSATGVWIYNPNTITEVVKTLENG